MLLTNVPHAVRLDDERCAAVTRQLDSARTLALHGAETVACEICASVFLEHGFALAASATLRQRYVECLLLLGLTQLLARFLRSVDGVEVTGSWTGESGGECLNLSFSNGLQLSMPWTGLDGETLERERAAAQWSGAVLETSAREASSAIPPAAPINVPNTQPSPTTQLHATHAT